MRSEVGCAEVAIRDSSYSSPRNRFFELRKRQSIHHIARFEPPAPRHRDPVLHILQMPDLV